MDQSVGSKIFDLQEKVLHQSETEELRGEYQYYNEKMKTVLEQMTEEQRDTVLGYVGAVTEMYVKMLEMAVQ